MQRTLHLSRPVSSPVPKPPLPASDNAKPSQLASIEAKTGLSFVSIPAGSFMMGGDKHDDEKPIHRVKLDGYWMSKYEVTVGQYAAYCRATGKSMPVEPNDGGNKFNPNWSKLDHPIVNVSWADAKGYCRWAGVDLPTEAEWEYASRGGMEGKEYPWGDVFNLLYMRCIASTKIEIAGTASVGSYPANGYGLYDMIGNVWEWCSDWYNAGYYIASPLQNPKGSESGALRVLRGGSWYDYYPDFFRCAFRYRGNPVLRYFIIGFRVVFRGLR